MNKTCKQCGRELSVDNFRRYAPRGRGIYKTTQGYHTICKSCEAISVKAAAALSSNDTATIDKLTDHYKALQSRGLAPATKPAKQLLGVATERSKRTNKLDDLLAEVTCGNTAELYNHCELVRNRGYASATEADEAHKRLASQLKQLDEDLYAEITDLVDDWYMEED